MFPAGKVTVTYQSVALAWTVNTKKEYHISKQCKRQFYTAA